MVKNPPANAGDSGSILGSLAREDHLKKGKGTHSSILAWRIPWTVWSTVLQREMEKEMAIHSSTLAWKIPWTEEPGRLQSMESQ